ncbi:MAG: DUF4835 family protein [Bacteroidales bacterium]
MKQLIFGIILILFALTATAQEIICNVQVNSQQIEGTDKRVYENMQQALTEFINNRQWTDYRFKPEERIECSMVLNIQSRPSTDRFRAQLNIVSSRPVFKTNYTTTILNYVDTDVEFEYVDFQPFDFQENSFTNNLVSVTAYYIYMILALDFDTFSQFGGTPFYEKAQNIVNAAQNAPESGWKAFEDNRNRYWLLENMTNNSYKDLREFLYQYHRLGMDQMADNAEVGRKAVAESLQYLKKVYDQRPGLFALRLIIDAKRDEIINIFSEGNPTEKAEIQQLMKEIDPSNASSYSKITARN